MKRKLLIALSVCIFAASLNCVTASAQENDAGSRVDFSVKAVLPDNQAESGQSFFDLRVTPGQTQVLQVRVYNNASAPLVVDIELNTASTNPGGVIDYGRPGIRDDSMQVAISDLAYIPEPQLTVPPNDSRVAAVGITMPEESFDGSLLGGIQIKKTVDEAEAASDTAGGTGIVNEYAYVVAVRLTETDTPVAPELNLKKIEPSLVNYKTAVTATIQNSAARIMKDMDVRAEIYTLGATEPLHEASKSGVDMAPNSVFEYAIDWGNEKIAPGNYSLHLTATHAEKTWEWNEPFTIAGEQAGEINDGAIDLTEASWFDNMVLYIAAGAAVLLLIIGMIWRRRRRRGYAR